MVETAGLSVLRDIEFLFAIFADCKSRPQSLLARDFLARQRVHTLNALAIIVIFAIGVRRVRNRQIFWRTGLRDAIFGYEYLLQDQFSAVWNLGADVLDDRL